MNRVMLGVIVVATLLGLAGGAMLPIPAYRLSVPWVEGQPVSPTRDTCGTCGEALAAGVPGWLCFGARCPRCAARLGPPTWLLAVVGGAGAAGLAWRIGPSPELLPYLFGLLLGLLLGTVDRLAQRLPDVLVYPGIGISVVLFGVVAVVDGGYRDLGRALLAGGVLFVGYLVLALLPGAGVGGGDLGLAALLGLYLGWMGWPVVVLGAALPWVLQAGASVVAIARGRAGARTMLAFGPAMLAGAYLVLVVLPGAGALLSG
jgi:leader peptidase (prepilin peptidase) / N-methyltransferase